jgi:3-oxoacyl-[acyl-carrier-protein] synthase-3
MEEVSRNILARNELKGTDLDLFIPHQANIRIINAAAERLGITDKQLVTNVHKYGNTTAGTIPLAIADALDDDRLHKGDLVLLSAVGAGFTVGSVLLRWAY